MQYILTRQPTTFLSLQMHEYIHASHSLSAIVKDVANINSSTWRLHHQQSIIWSIHGLLGQDMTKAHLFLHRPLLYVLLPIGVRMVLSNRCQGQVMSNRRKPSLQTESVATGTRSRTSWATGGWYSTVHAWFRSIGTFFLERKYTTRVWTHAPTGAISHAFGWSRVCVGVQDDKINHVSIARLQKIRSLSRTPLTLGRGATEHQMWCGTPATFFG
jgi:hypothetical protein